MQIDAATRRNLELLATLGGERRGSLLSVIDRTATGAGCRLLADHLAAPLTEPAAIRARLDAVQCFVERADVREQLRDRLRHCPDIERALTRLSLGRGGPRDLAALRDALGETASLRRMLTAPGLVPLPALVAEAEQRLGEHGALVDRLARALAAELPLFARDGGFIADAYSFELDQLRELRDQSRRTIAALQARYAEVTGVASAAHPPQQRHRLLHRGLGRQCRQARRAITSTARRWRGDALHHDRARRARKQAFRAPPSGRWRSNCASSTIWSAR